jgi:hypothetical protein
MHVLMENRNGLVMDIEVGEAKGRVEREMTKRLLGRVRKRHWLRPETVGMDKGYDDGEFLDIMEKELNIIPHVPTRVGRIISDDAPADARRRARKRQRTKAYQQSQRCRKRVEEIFGWLKTIGGLRKTRFVGRWKTRLYAYAAAAAYNFLRIVNLAPV